MVTFSSVAFKLAAHCNVWSESGGPAAEAAIGPLGPQVVQQHGRRQRQCPHCARNSPAPRAAPTAFQHRSRENAGIGRRSVHAASQRAISNPGATQVGPPIMPHSPSLLEQ